MNKKIGLERLKSKNKIDLVFKKGKSVRSGALIMHFFNPKGESRKTHIGVSVSKKSILLSYRRNRIKRQIRAIIHQQEKDGALFFTAWFLYGFIQGKIWC